MKSALNLKRELAVAAGIVVFAFLGTLWNIQPFQAVIDFGHNAKLSWEQRADTIRRSGFGRTGGEHPNLGTPYKGSYTPFGGGRGFGRQRTGMMTDQRSSDFHLKGRDYVRLGRLGTLTGTLIRQEEEWGLKVGDTVYMIHMGPVEFRDTRGVVLKEGKKTTVNGFIYHTDISVVTMEVDGKTIRLRDESGRPAWAGSPFGLKGRGRL